MPVFRGGMSVDSGSLVQAYLDEAVASATAQAQSWADAAAASYDAFDDRYLGSYATDPTLDNDGAGLMTGALYWNTTNNVLRIYNGASWQDVGSSTANTTVYTATAGQTTFSGLDDNSTLLAYTVGYVFVFLNGVLLKDTTDYTADNGTSIVLTTGCAAGDVLSTLGFGTFDVSTSYTKAETDGKYAAITHPRKNIIINPGMAIAQRGTSFPATSAAWVADRWRLINGTSGVVTGAQSALNPSANPVPVANYVASNTTTATASITAAQYAFMRYIVEGYDIRHLMWGGTSAKDVTLSFWHAHTKTGTYCVGFKNDAANRSYIVEYTQSVADTWEKTTVTIPGETTGTWVVNSGAGLYITFGIAMGSDFYTTADSWQTGNYLTTSNQVNGLDSTSNVFRLAAVQLEVGATATEFEQRPFADELAMCTRYYEYGEVDFAILGASSTIYGRTGVINFSAEKRSSPTVTLSNITGGASSPTNGGSNANVYGFSPRIDDTYTAHNVYSISFDWTADSEL